MRFAGECFRFHDPVWAWSPLSGAGAALHGRRFNWPGLETLYLSRRIETAIREVSAGFARRISPLTLCAYDVDCEDVVSLVTEAERDAAGVTLVQMNCAWAIDMAAGKRPPSWDVVQRVRDAGAAGILTPSFANGATADDINLVLWKWGPDLPHRAVVYDPDRKLPRNASSWTD